MSDSVLSIRIRKSFPGFSLDLDERLDLTGVTAVFGPSGSGKSTLLRLIAGLDRPDRGRIAMGSALWFDQDQQIHTPPHERPVGYMFQDARLFGHLTVHGNLAFAARRSGDRANGYDLETVAAAFDLEPLLMRKIQTLSGGERQRVALARTLLTCPDLLLLDEPFAALDLARKHDILPYLEDLPGRFGTPALFVSHDIEEVSQLADRILVLNKGRVEAHGPAAAIINRLPLEAVTGRFETSTLLDAIVTGQDARLCLTALRLDGQAISMPMNERLTLGDTVRLRIRARDVAIATVHPAGLSIRNVLKARVHSVTPEQGTAFADALLDIGAVQLRARITRAAAEDLSLTPGMEVFALVKSVSFDGRLS